MDWRKEAINDLKHHAQRQTALGNLKDDIATIEAQLSSVKSPTSDTTPVQGGGCPAEERIIGLIDERDRKRQAYGITRRQVQKVERALACITEQQRDVLDTFYVHRTQHHVDRLSEKYHIECSRVYQLKDEAIIDFTRARYGLIEL